MPCFLQRMTHYTGEVFIFCGASGKESACQCSRHQGSTPELGRSPEEGNGNPVQYSCHGEFHGQRSLEGYSPWGRKEMGTNEYVSAVSMKNSKPSHGRLLGGCGFPLLEFSNMQLPNLHKCSCFPQTGRS